MTGNGFGTADKPVAMPLTNREYQILTLLACGRTSKEIATRLNISLATVGSHRRSLCRKLNVHSTAELVHWAGCLAQMSVNTVLR